LKRFVLTTGIKQNYEQLSQAEKVQLRYNYILSVTKTHKVTLRVHPVVLQTKQESLLKA
jgi:hypothetical protein